MSLKPILSASASGHLKARYHPAVVHLCCVIMYFLYKNVLLPCFWTVLSYCGPASINNAGWKLKLTIQCIKNPTFK